MSISKRFWDLARSNLTDFRAAFSRNELRDLLTSHEESVDDEASDDGSGSVGARAGRKVREVRDAAEEAWERAYEAAQRRAGAAPGTERITEIERRRWYRTLELDPGAGLVEVRKAYRRLLMQFHPDRHASDPEKFRAASEVTRRLTEAYNGLTRDLQG